MLVSTKTDVIEKEMPTVPEEGRKVHVILAFTSFISSLAILFYLLACGALIFTSIPADPFKTFFPAIYLAACVLAFSIDEL